MTYISDVPSSYAKTESGLARAGVDSSGTTKNIEITSQVFRFVIFSICLGLLPPSIVYKRAINGFSNIADIWIGSYYTTRPDSASSKD
jgi:hypothetical protein